ncbi:MAG: M23 family metallopeptidase [Saprospiraceae bacterium]|nr:M23 family metallopeptidase [Saprospiraceae bacterium]
MAKKEPKLKRWRERLKNTYRLVVMNNDTFEEIGSYKLTLLNFYLIGSTLAVLVSVLILFFIVLTPLKRLIPGYGDVNVNNEIRDLERELSDLSDSIMIQRNYTESFRKILVGEVETELDAADAANISEDTVELVAPNKEDTLLRQEVELEETRRVTQNAIVSNINDAGLPIDQIFFSPPVKGEISAPYNVRNKHYGIDLIAPKDSPILSVLRGTVISAGWDMDFGFTIAIQHANNLITLYKHNSALLKEVGDFVKAGEAIAIIGNTGEKTDGPHLHFELWHNGVSIDPEMIYKSFK